MNEDTLKQISQLIERHRQEGYRAGQEAAREHLLKVREKASELWALLESLEPKPRRQRRPETRPRLKNPIETLGIPVLDAVANLAAGHPEGVDPAAIAMLIDGGDIRQVRLVLRHLTLSGAVLRVARGRYLPAANPTLIAAE